VSRRASRAPDARGPAGRGDEELAPGKIEAGARLVEHEELGVGHQRAGEHDARTLALRQAREEAFCVAVDLDELEQLVCARRALVGHVLLE
jgi:hypothetical protein